MTISEMFNSTNSVDTESLIENIGPAAMDLLTGALGLFGLGLNFWSYKRVCHLREQLTSKRILKCILLHDSVGLTFNGVTYSALKLGGIHLANYQSTYVKVFQILASGSVLVSLLYLALTAFDRALKAIRPAVHRTASNKRWVQTALFAAPFIGYLLIIPGVKFCNFYQNDCRLNLLSSEFQFLLPFSINVVYFGFALFVMTVCNSVVLFKSTFMRSKRHRRTKRVIEMSSRSYSKSQQNSCARSINNPCDPRNSKPIKKADNQCRRANSDSERFKNKNTVKYLNNYDFKPRTDGPYEISTRKTSRQSAAELDWDNMKDHFENIGQLNFSIKRQRKQNLPSHDVKMVGNGTSNKPNILRLLILFNTSYTILVFAISYISNQGFKNEGIENGSEFALSFMQFATVVNQMLTTLFLYMSNQEFRQNLTPKNRSSVEA